MTIRPGAGDRGDPRPIVTWLLNNSSIPSNHCAEIACLLDPDGTKTSWPWYLKLKQRCRGRLAKGVDPIDLVQLAQLFLSNDPPPEARRLLAQLLDPEGTGSEMPWRLELVQKGPGNLQHSDLLLRRSSLIVRTYNIYRSVVLVWTVRKMENPLANWESAVKEVIAETGLSRGYVTECYGLWQYVLTSLEEDHLE